MPQSILSPYQWHGWASARAGKSVRGLKWARERVSKSAEWQKWAKSTKWTKWASVSEEDGARKGRRAENNYSWLGRRYLREGESERERETANGGRRRGIKNLPEFHAKWLIKASTVISHQEPEWQSTFCKFIPCEFSIEAALIGSSSQLSLFFPHFSS